MVKVVAAVVAGCSLPSMHALSLMLNQNALLELGIVVSARVSTIKRDLESVELILSMLLGSVLIVRHYRLDDKIRTH